MASLHTVLKQNFPKENKLPANREGCGPSLKVRSAECEAHTHMSSCTCRKHCIGHAQYVE